MMGLGPKHSRLKDPKRQSTKYLNDEDPATQKGHTKEQLNMHVAHARNYGAACDAIINHYFTSYESWSCFIQAVVVSYAQQVVKLMDRLLILAGKATLEMNKELNTQKMGAPLLHKTCYLHRHDPMLPSHVTFAAQTSLMASFY